MAQISADLEVCGAGRQITVQRHRSGVDQSYLFRSQGLVIGDLALDRDDQILHPLIESLPAWGNGLQITGWVIASVLRVQGTSAGAWLTAIDFHAVYGI